MSFAIYKKPALVKDDSPEEIQKTELALMEWASYAPIKLKFIKFITYPLDSAILDSLSTRLIKNSLYCCGRVLMIPIFAAI